MKESGIVLISSRCGKMTAAHGTRTIRLVVSMLCGPDRLCIIVSSIDEPEL